MVLAVAFPLWHSGPVSKNDCILHNGRNGSAILAQLEYTIKNGQQEAKKGAVSVSDSCNCTTQQDVGKTGHDGDWRNN